VENSIARVSRTGTTTPRNQKASRAWYRTPSAPAGRGRPAPTPTPEADLREQPPVGHLARDAPDLEIDGLEERQGPPQVAVERARMRPIRATMTPCPSSSR
jgi:hypothetical protein